QDSLCPNPPAPKSTSSIFFFSHLHIHTKTRNPNQHHRCPISAFCVSCSCFILLSLTHTHWSHFLFSPSPLPSPSPSSNPNPTRAPPSTHPLNPPLSASSVAQEASSRTRPGGILCARVRPTRVPILQLSHLCPGIRSAQLSSSLHSSPSQVAARAIQALRVLLFWREHNCVVTSDLLEFVPGPTTSLPLSPLFRLVPKSKSRALFFLFFLFFCFPAPRPPPSALCPRPRLFSVRAPKQPSRPRARPPSMVLSRLPSIQLCVAAASPIAQSGEMIDIGPLAPTHASSKPQFPMSTTSREGDAGCHRRSLPTYLPTYLPAASLRRRPRCKHRIVRIPRLSSSWSMPRTGYSRFSANLDRTTRVRRARLTS
ncbi:hypothetical protein F4859DRAFT_129495, partial [Xylaria cf. heliscus]